MGQGRFGLCESEWVLIKNSTPLWASDHCRDHSRETVGADDEENKAEVVQSKGGAPALRFNEHEDPAQA